MGVFYSMPRSNIFHTLPVLNRGAIFELADYVQSRGRDRAGEWTFRVSSSWHPELILSEFEASIRFLVWPAKKYKIFALWAWIIREKKSAVRDACFGRITPHLRITVRIMTLTKWEFQLFFHFHVNQVSIFFSDVRKIHIQIIWGFDLLYSFVVIETNWTVRVDEGDCSLSDSKSHCMKSMVMWIIGWCRCYRFCNLAYIIKFWKKYARFQLT